MAKKSSVEKNEKRRKLAKKFAAKRARLKAITKNRDAGDGRAFRGAAQACAAAAQFRAEPHSQPLRD